MKKFPRIFLIIKGRRQLLSSDASAQERLPKADGVMYECALRPKGSLRLLAATDH